jgi:hypothetical protein
MANPGLAANPNLVASWTNDRRSAVRRFFVKLWARRWGLRFAKVFAAYVTAGSSTMMLLLWSQAGGGDLDLLALRGVGWLTALSGGLVLLSLTGALATTRQDPATLALLRQRGMDDDDCQRGGRAAVATILIRWLLVPSCILGVVALALCDSLALVPVRLAQLAALAIYCVACGFGGGWLAASSAKLAPTRPRTLLLLIVALPHVSRQIWPGTPSLPALLAWLLEQIGSLGQAGAGLSGVV